MSLIREVRFIVTDNGIRTEFLVHGQLGTVQFVFMDWERETPPSRGLITSYERVPLDFGYHWDRKRYKGQHSMKTCDKREANRCFYDGSGLEAERILTLLITQGHEAVWRELESYYATLADGENK